MASGYEIAVILIALAAVGIACWALGEARKAGEAEFELYDDGWIKRELGQLNLDLSAKVEEAEFGLYKDVHKVSLKVDALAAHLGLEVERVHVPPVKEHTQFRVREIENDG